MTLKNLLAFYGPFDTAELVGLPDTYPFGV
jgi:hypothetical protein